MEYQILPKDLKKKIDSKEDFILLDVRNSDEYEIAKIKGSKLIPLNELENKFNELSKDKEIIVYCHRGIRSQRAVEFLKEKGYKNVKSLVGGIDVWYRFIDDSIPQY